MKYFIFLIGFALCSCTISVNLIHSEGTTQDVVDANQSASPDIKAEVPISGI